jgi:hypothetical protein
MFFIFFFVFRTCFRVLVKCCDIVCIVCTVVGVSLLRFDSEETEVETWSDRWEQGNEQKENEKERRHSIIEVVTLFFWFTVPKGPWISFFNTPWIKSWGLSNIRIHRDGPRCRHMPDQWALSTFLKFYGERVLNILQHAKWSRISASEVWFPAREPRPDRLLLLPSFLSNK